MTRSSIATVALVAVLAPFTATPAAHAAPPVGTCSQRGYLVASGSWTASAFILTGTQNRVRQARDQWTDITVAGVTYPNVSIPVRIRRAVPRGTEAHVVFRGSWGLRDHRCTFTLGRP